MNKRIILLTAILLMMTMTPLVFADHHEEPAVEIDVVMGIGETTYTVNGIQRTMDVAPYIEAGRTMVPISFIARSFGLTPDFGPVDGLTEWVTFEKDDLLIEIEIGSANISVTESDVTRIEVSDVAASIRNGRTYMPLRIVGEILGAAFDWGPKDSATQWVSFSTGVSAPAAPTVVNEIAVKLVAEGFTSPLAYVSPQDGTGRMFVVDQIGLIRVVEQNRNVQTEPFLDLRDRMVSLRPGFDERGLLGMAFHPDFSSNGRFFVHYSAPPRAGGPSGWDHTAVISEFKVSENSESIADPASERILMQIDQPQFNHNGGHITFGPEGYFYIPLGDGGGSNDTSTGHPDMGNGQDITTLLGSILRIDVDRGDPYGIPADNPFVGMEGRDEIFAYGLRNPYRISFDAMGNNDLFVADVGQELWEEVNIVTSGGNYGWNLKEGTHCFDPQRASQPPANCPDTGRRGEPLIDPIFEYRNARNQGIGISVIGGYVYRGSAIPQLNGNYVFADWSSRSGGADGVVFAANQVSGVWRFRELAVSNRSGQRIGAYITGMGQDDNHELYVLTTASAGPAGNTGQVFRIISPDGLQDRMD
jgi:glucose/arabinose dehydrogenase